MSGLTQRGGIKKYLIWCLSLSYDHLSNTVQATVYSVGVGDIMQTHCASGELITGKFYSQDAENGISLTSDLEIHKNRHCCYCM